jgi:hypothetical protein
MIGTISEIGKFGGLKINGEFYSPSKFAKGLPQFEVGKSYDFQVQENLSKKDGKTYRNIVAARAVGAVSNPAPVVAKAPVEAAEAAPKVSKAVKKTEKPVAFGRELSDYELHKDVRIGVAGIVQALIQSPIYMPQIEMLDPAKVDEFLLEKAKLWLANVKELSEGK